MMQPHFGARTAKPSNWRHSHAVSGIRQSVGVRQIAVRALQHWRPHDVYKRRAEDQAPPWH